MTGMKLDFFDGVVSTILICNLSIKIVWNINIIKNVSSCYQNSRDGQYVIKYFRLREVLLIN
jgi:hypothetical protein